MAEKREQPYIWVTWLVRLMAGEHSCEWKAWTNAHWKNPAKRQRDDGYNSATWNQRHAAYTATLAKEYRRKCKRLLIEGETKWYLRGKTATVGGAMDLVTLEPNLVIDGKTGKPKDSHIVQVQIYLLALERGAVGNLGKLRGFSGVLRYSDEQYPTIEIPPIEDEFRERFYAMVRRIADEAEPVPVPSAFECKYCDLADCKVRVEEEPEGAEVEEF